MHDQIKEYSFYDIPQKNKMNNNRKNNDDDHNTQSDVKSLTSIGSSLNCLYNLHPADDIMETLKSLSFRNKFIAIL